MDFHIRLWHAARMSTEALKQHGNRARRITSPA